MGYEDYQTDKPDVLATLATLADELGDQQAEAARIGAELKKVNKRIGDLEEREIPDLMEEAGVASLTTSNGVPIKVTHAYRTKSVSNVDALDWLTEEGHGGLIKTEVAVVFGRDAHEDAKQLKEQLAAEGMTAKMLTHVNAQTLKGFLNELEKDNDGIPVDQDILDRFGAYRQRKAKVGK